MITVKTIREKITELRKKKLQLTTAQFAFLLDVDPSTVRHWERYGGNMPSIENLCKLLSLFKKHGVKLL